MKKIISYLSIPLLLLLLTSCSQIQPSENPTWAETTKTIPNVLDATYVKVVPFTPYVPTVSLTVNQAISEETLQQLTCSSKLEPQTTFIVHLTTPETITAKTTTVTLTNQCESVTPKVFTYSEALTLASTITPNLDVKVTNQTTGNITFESKADTYHVVYAGDVAEFLTHLNLDKDPLTLESFKITGNQDTQSEGYPKEPAGFSYLISGTLTTTQEAENVATILHEITTRNLSSQISNFEIKEGNIYITPSSETSIDTLYILKELTPMEVSIYEYK